MYSATLFVATPMHSEIAATSSPFSIRVAPIEAGPGLPFAAPSENIVKVDELVSGIASTVLLVFF